MSWLRERFEALRSIFEPFSNGAEARDQGRFAIVEIMGHRKVAGRVHEVQAFGRTMIEVVCAEPSQTVVKLSPTAIFAITECSKEEAEAYQNGAPPDPLALARSEAKAAEKRRSHARFCSCGRLWIEGATRCSSLHCLNGRPDAVASSDSQAAQKHAFAEYDARGKLCLMCGTVEIAKDVCSDPSCPLSKAEPEPIDGEFEGPPSSSPLSDDQGDA